MAVEKKIEALEGEFKLMKGELKETLAGVRDFLLSLNLPTPQIEGLEGEQSRLGIDGGLSLNSTTKALPPLVAAVEQSLPKGVVQQPEPEPVFQPVEQVEPALAPEAEIETPPVQEEETPPQLPVSELPEQPVQFEERPDTGLPLRIIERKRGEVVPTSPQVNLLANLLRWVSAARKEIGGEQLPTFLEVYGTTGNLSPQLREVILHLADVVAQESLDTASIWGQLMREQLATYLDVQSVNGNLSPELKEGILRLTDIMAQQSSDARNASVWDQLVSEQLATFLEVHCANGQLSAEVKEGILRITGAMAQPSPGENVADMAQQPAERLHGILSGGGTLLHPLQPFWRGKEEETPVGETGAEESDEGDGPVGLEQGEPVMQEEDKPEEERPVRLKLVLPISGGAEREFNINLAPEVGGEDSSGRSSAE